LKSRPHGSVADGLPVNLDGVQPLSQERAILGQFVERLVEAHVVARQLQAEGSGHQSEGGLPRASVISAKQTHCRA
jgi:hypothetical protein